MPEHSPIANEHGNAGPPRMVPDHELLRCIGCGSYGEVWLARNVVGTLRAVKVVYRKAFLVMGGHAVRYYGVPDSALVLSVTFSR